MTTRKTPRRWKGTVDAACLALRSQMTESRAQHEELMARSRARVRQSFDLLARPSGVLVARLSRVRTGQRPSPGQRPPPHI